MARCKVIFNDNGDKRIDGEVDVNADSELIKILTDDGKVIYVSKAKITFIKEL